MTTRLIVTFAALALLAAPAPAFAQDAQAPAARPKAQPKRNARDEEMRQEAARREACAQAAQNATNTAVGTAVLGGMLDIAGAGALGRGGWALSAAGNTVSNAGAAAAQGEMNVASARHGC